MGVDDAVIATRLDGQGRVAYKCCRCRGRATRTEGPQGNDFDMINQMLSIVGNLASEFKKLAAKSLEQPL